jgi:AcrR family transcriptional regulator
MNKSSGPAKNSLDRRILRTRQLLFDSFEQLLDERRSISRITISSIAAKANVNRVTVYAHFTDKHDLVAQWKREKFRQRLFDEEDAIDGRDVSYAKIIKTVISFMVGYKSYFKILNKEYEPLFESAIQHEMSRVIYKKIIKEGRPINDKALITATFISAAIFGTINEWSAERNEITETFLTNQILEYIELIIEKSAN